MIDAQKVASLVLSGLIGAGVGWAAQALTLGGRVDALERSQAVIITRLDTLIEAKRVAEAPRP